MHALIIEDEPLIAMSIEDVLRISGYTSFDFAICAEGAVNAASSRPLLLRKRRLGAAWELFNGVSRCR